MRKKGIYISLIIIISIIFLGGAISLYLFGKPIKVNIDTELNGVSDELFSILYYGSFAANSHNTQSWKVELDEKEQKINILFDKERMLEIVDPECREIYISLGCYIESLIYAFDAYGYDTMIEYTNSSNNNSEIASISYYKKNNGKIDSRKLDIIKRRHTDKRSYNTNKINREVIKKIIEDTNGIYCYENDSEEFEYLKKGTMDAISKQSIENTYLKELNQWMRFSNKEVETKKDGISAEMIGLRGIIKAFYYLTTNHKNAESDTFAKQGIDTAKKQINNCSAFFVITGNNKKNDWIETGRKTQEFWYRCVENNISIQAISAMLEVVPYKENIQSDLGLTENVQMILRAGYINDYGENAGVRRDLRDYVTVISRD